MYPAPPRDYDSVAYLDPRSTKVDGHHGEAIEAWLREMCPDTWHRPPTEHRIARKKGIIGPGEIEVPRGTGMRLQSIRYLDIECRQTTLVGTGTMPAVLDIDGSSFGKIYGSLTVIGRRPHGGGRTEVPRDIIQVHKSSQVHSTPQQTHFEVEATIEGVWREWAFRGGSRDWNEVQEDHGRGKLLIFGFQGFDITKDDANDLCQGGVVCGFPNWSNNRRWWFDWISVVSVGTAVGCNRSAVDVRYLTADGCRDVLSFAGAQNKMTIHAGEAELCSRLIVDAMHSGHDQTVHVSDFYAKLDQWRPGLLPPLGWRQDVWDQYPNAIGAWATAGKCLLDNVSFANLPVRRSKKDGTLRYAKMRPRTRETAAGVEEYELTDIPAPRFYSCRPFANIKTRDCSAWGYAAGRGYNEFFAKSPEGAGEISHEDWKNCREGDGVILTHVSQAIKQE